LEAVTNFIIGNLPVITAGYAAHEQSYLTYNFSNFEPSSTVRLTILETGAIFNVVSDESGRGLGMEYITLDGTYTLRASDDYGNVATCSFTATGTEPYSIDVSCVNGIISYELSGFGSFLVKNVKIRHIARWIDGQPIVTILSKEISMNNLGSTSGTINLHAPNGSYYFYVEELDGFTLNYKEFTASGSSVSYYYVIFTDSSVGWFTYAELRVLLQSLPGSVSAYYGPYVTMPS
jgi:hypothetical protein